MIWASWILEIMVKRNYQKELEQIIEKEKDLHKKVLLHSCCAPCSSYCMEYLREFFDTTVFYFNPNISLREEYEKRVEEQKKLIAFYNEEVPQFPIAFLEGKYDPQSYFAAVKGLEDCKEGGERCFACFALRLKETAIQAKQMGMDYFTTTLTISPLKNAEKINEIGFKIADEVGINWLPCDFKKKNGYLRSIELSEKYGLYRQDFCGCGFSKAEREAMRGTQNKEYTK